MYHAVVEATVQRARPVVLTALAAVLAFIPLTFSLFWGSMAYTLIGGTAVGTVLTLGFLPALSAIWFKVRPAVDSEDEPAIPTRHLDRSEPARSAPERSIGQQSIWMKNALIDGNSTVVASAFFGTHPADSTQHQDRP